MITVNQADIEKQRLDEDPVGKLDQARKNVLRQVKARLDAGEKSVIVSKGLLPMFFQNQYLLSLAEMKRFFAEYGIDVEAMINDVCFAKRGT